MSRVPTGCRGGRAGSGSAEQPATWSKDLGSTHGVSLVAPGGEDERSPERPGARTLQGGGPMRRPAAVLVLCASLLAAGSLALAEEARPLRLVPGEPVRIVVEQTKEILRPAQSEVPIRTRTTTRTYLLRCDAAEVGSSSDGAVRLSVTLERLQTVSRAHGSVQEIDTDTAEGAACPEGRFVNQPVVCRLSPRGELVEVEQALGTTITDLPREQRCRLKGLVGDGVVSDTLGFATPFPEAALEVGATWTHRAIVQGPAAVGEIALVVTNTVVELRPDSVVIEQQGAREDEAHAPTTLAVTRCEARLVLSRTDGLVVEGQGELTLEVGEGDDRLVMHSTCHRRRQSDPSRGGR